MKMKFVLLIFLIYFAVMVWILYFSLQLSLFVTPVSKHEESQPIYFRKEFSEAGHDLQGSATLRPGMVMLLSLYAHLPSVTEKYSSISKYLIHFIEKMKKDITVRGVAKDPWELAREWATPNSLVPETAPGLGDILAALSTAPIVSAAPAVGGSQFKIILWLEGKQKVVLAPKIHSLDSILIGKNRGGDRHNGEIVAFHLGRLLGLQMTPIAVGRKVSLKREILPVATQRLAETFSKNKNGDTCFYGICRYCKPQWRVCAVQDTLSCAVIMWLPEHLSILEIDHPWRDNKKNVLARWEYDENYCQEVLVGDQGGKILDIIDVSVLDYIIQNTDRHNAVYIAGEPDSSFVPIDNGKSFGDPHTDYTDMLAPVLQCCRIRQATYERLVLLSGGGMSLALQELLALDPVAPVLTPAHLRATDRRVTHLLAALSACSVKKGGWHNVLF
ncbi:glycosaminoglycan xylosylkinase-like [Penaeus japonicus]|uniref:glycosaminoglycan xylosylkinase-like n=1 Tax=Penaeus japonicus TaxID=27405 RepID=UPI001C7141CC|nr:glycosaminoglycan xylosylkinase-like [Penaeus japonicus]